MAIKVLIVDDVADTRESVRRLLSLDQEIRVIGSASNGREAVGAAAKLNPDVVLMDINMPVMDGITATEQISLRQSDVSVVMMSVQGEQEYLKKAMLAGARDFITKPFSNDELTDTVKRVYAIEQKKKDGFIKNALESEPQIITLVGTKGGVGKTTIAANLAVALRQITNAGVALVDLDLQFGDVAAILNVIPRQTIAELVQDSGDIDTELVENYMYTHRASGTRVLCAPVKPEHSELVAQGHVEQILKVLKQNYQYVIVDTSPYFTDTNLAALELCSRILVVVGMDLLAVKNTKLALNIMESLNMRGKMDFLLNCTSEGVGLRIEDVQNALGCEIWAQIPGNNRVAVGGINRGVPFILSHPTSAMSESIYAMAKMIVQAKRPMKKKQRMLAGLF